MENGSYRNQLQNFRKKTLLTPENVINAPPLFLGEGNIGWSQKAGGQHLHEALHYTRGDSARATLQYFWTAGRLNIRTSLFSLTSPNKLDFTPLKMSFPGCREQR